MLLVTAEDKNLSILALFSLLFPFSLKLSSNQPFLSMTTINPPDKLKMT